MAQRSPTLLFIHGFPLDSTLWRPQMQDLGRTHRVLAPDLRGFGANAGDLPEAMTMELYANDLKDLLDHERVEDVVLVGLSMGGYIAMSFLDQWPGMVRGLVLANTRAGADDKEGVKARMEMARNAHDKGMAVIAKGMVPKLLSDRSLSSGTKLASEVEAMIARQRPMATAAAARGMAQRPDRSTWLRNVKVPTLVLTGEQDKLMPLATSQAMADAIRGATLVVLRGAGHLSNLERPDLFNQHLAHFMNRW